MEVTIEQSFGGEDRVMIFGVAMLSLIYRFKFYRGEAEWFENG